MIQISDIQNENNEDKNRQKGTEISPVLYEARMLSRQCFIIWAEKYLGTLKSDFSATRNAKLFYAVGNSIRRRSTSKRGIGSCIMFREPATVCSDLLVSLSSPHLGNRDVVYPSCMGYYWAVAEIDLSKSVAILAH